VPITNEVIVYFFVIELNLLNVLLRWTKTSGYNSMMSEEADMNVENEKDADVKIEHVDYSNAFNIFQVFM